MEDLHFKNHQEFDRFLSTAKKFDNQGIEGVVYKKDDTVIKDFRSTDGLCDERVLEFRDLDIRDFYFAKAGIYIRMKLRACITEYAPGMDLNEANLFCVNIDLLLQALIRLENSVRELSNEGIMVSDTHEGNILFSDECFRFIDTLSYVRTAGFKDTYDTNMGYIMSIIYDNIFKYYSSLMFQFLESRYPRIRISNNFNYLTQMLKIECPFYLTNPSDSLRKFRSILEEIIDDEFETFGEAEVKLDSFIMKTI